jgi:hypothetical protein
LPPTQRARAANQAAELAKELSNPVAALISVPMQNSRDFGSGRTRRNPESQ